MQSPRIAIVEDDPRYREGLELLLEGAAGGSIVASFPAAEPMLAALEELAASTAPQPRWDLLLLDIALPGMGGLEALRAVRRLAPSLVVIMVTSFEDPARIVEAIVSGADGYIVKKAAPEEVVADVRAVLEGGAPLTAGVARTVMELLRREPPAGAARRAPAGEAALDEPLSPQEARVLRALAHGLSYKQVAAEHGTSLDTVRSHIRNLYRKLQVHSAPEAIAKAHRHGLV